ncbi:MAG TPA: hypothetical protein VK787_08635 [Puia sp.]|jgi:N-acetylneuraminic acid mutarotase|nr:hypothetical protein [Puia sp.]
MNRNFILCLLFAFSTVLNSCHKNCCNVEASTGNWVKLSDFSSVTNVRSETVTFVIDDLAYLTGGVDKNFIRYNDLWQFGPVKILWTQKASLPSSARSSAVGMNINDKGYVGTGYDGTNLLKDFWQYDPSSNSWAQKASFTGIARYDAVAFGIQNYGYIATGFDTASLKDC